MVARRFVLSFSPKEFSFWKEAMMTTGVTLGDVRNISWNFSELPGFIFYYFRTCFPVSFCPTTVPTTSTKDSFDSFSVHHSVQGGCSPSHNKVSQQ